MWTDLLMSILMASIITTVFIIIGYYTYRVLNRLRKDDAIPPIISNRHVPFIPNSVMEDPKEQQLRAAVRKAYAEQEQAIMARSLKAHAFDCPDPWTCTKDPCFIRTPDVVVATRTVFRKTDEERTKELKSKRKTRLK